MPYTWRLESGPWHSVGEPLDGPEVVERVRAVRRRPGGAVRPYAVYVHVPFCVSICSFCALYTHGVGSDADDRFDAYTDAVLRSIELHPWTGALTPPTTVHFGGGTPLILGNTRFERIVRALRDAFGTSPDCEWAVETTTSSLDHDTVDALQALEIRRIHLGIQTLHDPARARAGRKESGALAVARLMALQERGFLTSVDLILGLAGVSEAALLGDLHRLVEAGVQMFSICELRERGRAARKASEADRELARRHYGLWESIWCFMEDAGLIPIHVGQFARSQADNLYFTHPARGEDCVAIGPYAHGSAAEVSYGNLLLPDYYEAVRAGAVPIAMGVDFRAGEQVVCALERELLTHRISRAALADMLATYRDRFEPILDGWLRNRLLGDMAGQEAFALTMRGSWFVGNMIAEVRGLAEASSRLPG